MKLTSMTFENYKAFHKRQSVEIRPLTVLIGHNNSGKSVIARLPLLIARSLSEHAESPLDLAFDGLDFGASFTDIVYNRLPYGAVGIGAAFISDEGVPVEFFSKIQHFNEYRLQLVTELTMKSPSSEPITLSWTGRDPLKEMKRYRREETGLECEVSFRGILPHTLRPHNIVTDAILKADWPDILSLRHIGNMRSVTDSINYLGPFRKEPKRMYRFPGSLSHGVGLRGEKAPELLGSDLLRRKGRVLSAVNAWFSQYMGGWTLDVAEQGDIFSLVLRNPLTEVNLADVGTGMAQVLPIVVQHHFETVTGKRSNINIVEQPELHLHPGAHGPLADLYVEAVKHSDIRFLVETHSENFLLRVRRRIAEGGLDPDKVIVYWVDDASDSDSHVQPIKIDANGDVDIWPESVFREDFEEVRAIRRAQKERERTTDTGAETRIRNEKGRRFLAALSC